MTEERKEVKDKATKIRLEKFKIISFYLDF